MKTTSRRLFFGLYFFLGLLMEAVILWLFPYTGLGGLICWPIAIGLSLLLGFLLFVLLKKPRDWRLNLFTFVALLSVQFLAQLSSTPQDYGGDVFSKIESAKNSIAQYASLQAGDFPSLSLSGRAAYIAKFEESLPDTYTLLRIDSAKNGTLSAHKREYLIENRDGQRFYDTKQISIVENDTATLIVEYLDADSLRYQMHPNFMNVSGGYDDRIISLGISNYDFALDSGHEKVVYWICYLLYK